MTAPDISRRSVIRGAAYAVPAVTVLSLTVGAADAASGGRPTDGVAPVQPLPTDPATPTDPGTPVDPADPATSADPSSTPTTPGGGLGNGDSGDLPVGGGGSGTGAGSGTTGGFGAGTEGTTQAGGDLPFTGGPIAAIAATGAAVVGAGVALEVLGRRRAEPSA